MPSGEMLREALRDANGNETTPSTDGAVEVLKSVGEGLVTATGVAALLIGAGAGLIARILNGGPKK